LQSVAEHCSALQSVAERCRVLQSVAERCRALQSIAERCRALQSIWQSLILAEGKKVEFFKWPVDNIFKSSVKISFLH
jgi:hypothetical protein